MFFVINHVPEACSCTILDKGSSLNSTSLCGEWWQAGVVCSHGLSANHVHIVQKQILSSPRTAMEGGVVNNIIGKL